MHQSDDVSTGVIAETEIGHEPLAVVAARFSDLIFSALRRRSCLASCSRLSICSADHVCNHTKSTPIRQKISTISKHCGSIIEYDVEAFGE